MKYQLLGLLLLHFQLCYLSPLSKILKTIPNEITPLHSSQINIFQTLQSFLNETHAGDQIIIATTYFTNIHIANYLKKKAQMGVNISVVIDKASWNNPKSMPLSEQILMQLKNSNIATHLYNENSSRKKNGYPSQMHLKSIIWQHNTPTNKFFRIFSGSANLSTAATQNRELMMFHPNNYLLFNQYEKYFKYLKKDAITTKPFQENITQIQPFKLYTSIIKTLLHLINNPDTPKKIKINTYTYNCQSLTLALIKALNLGTKIQLIIDQKSLDNTSAQKQLQQLSQAGAQVLVWHSKNQTNHAKYCLLKYSKAYTIAEGSANFTSNADQDINQITVHANNNKLYTILDAIFEKTATESTALSLI